MKTFIDPEPYLCDSPVFVELYPRPRILMTTVALYGSVLWAVRSVLLVTAQTRSSVHCKQWKCNAFGWRVVGDWLFLTPRLAGYSWPLLAFIPQAISIKHGVDTMQLQVVQSPSINHFPTFLLPLLSVL